MSTLSLEEKNLLAEKLLACPSCATRTGRERVIAKLFELFQWTITVGATSNDLTETLAIIDACLNYEDGLDALIKVVAFFDGGTLAFGELQSYANSLSGRDGLRVADALNFWRDKCEVAVALSEQVNGPEHPDTATCLNNLAVLFYYTGELETALAMFR